MRHEVRKTEAIANAITHYCLNKKYIPEEKKEIYCYGFKLIFADIINFTLVLLLALIFGEITSGIAFLITLCSVRKHSGGFHAKTFWLCRLSMLVTFISVLAVKTVVAKTDYLLPISIALNIISVIIIAKLAPVKHPNKTMNERQIKLNKKNAIIASAVMAAVSTVLTAAGITEGVTITITLSADVILMIIGLISTKGGKTNV